ncbi:MAG: hypothetical protein K0Q49_70 [Haloplasmataceae bacterium]|jgi:hypothetical protein|nr:hypothetical protein [Haloplasmataceae bacterium]
MPLVNIYGIGIVVNALIGNKPFTEVTQIIIIYLSISLIVTIIGIVLTLVDNIIRLNDGSDFLSNKYQDIIISQSRKLKKFTDKLTTINLISIIITVIQTAFMYPFTIK